VTYLNGEERISGARPASYRWVAGLFPWG